MPQTPPLSLSIYLSFYWKTHPYICKKVAEFSVSGLPIITSNHSDIGERFHLKVLGEKGLYYHDAPTLKRILIHFREYSLMKQSQYFDDIIGNVSDGDLKHDNNERSREKISENSTSSSNLPSFSYGLAPLGSHFWNAYQEYSPEIVMSKFNQFLLLQYSIDSSLDVAVDEVEGNFNHPPPPPAAVITNAQLLNGQNPSTSSSSSSSTITSRKVYSRQELLHLAKKENVKEIVDGVWADAYEALNARQRSVQKIFTALNELEIMKRTKAQVLSTHIFTHIRIFLMFILVQIYSSHIGIVKQFSDQLNSFF
jgi:hypothetical protein